MTLREAGASLYERTGLCAHCDRPFDKKRSDQRFCGKVCARRWYADHPRPSKNPFATETPQSEEPQVELPKPVIADAVPEVTEAHQRLAPAPEPSPFHPDLANCALAALFIETLLARPGVGMVKVWCGPIEIEVQP